jgi:histone H3/H4
MSDSTWKVCSTCKKPIPFEGNHFLCSVSTCNRKRIGLYFCSVACWDAHLPEARHRDAWAEPNKAPTRAEWEKAEREEAEATRPQPVAEEAPVRRRVVQSEVDDPELPRDVLIVVSKLKAYVRARSGMNTSDNVTGILSEHLRRLCNEAIRNAAKDGRKTVLDRDFEPLVE